MSFFEKRYSEGMRSAAFVEGRAEAEEELRALTASESDNPDTAADAIGITIVTSYQGPPASSSATSGFFTIIEPEASYTRPPTSWTLIADLMPTTTLLNFQEKEHA